MWPTKWQLRMNKKIALMGECMVELSRVNANTLKQGFGGDVYNTGVYLKRVFNSTEVGLMSCLGTDALSQQMAAAFNAENIHTHFLRYSEKHIPGAYLINTDEQGERTFVYWRDNSAARQIIRNLDEALSKDLENLDMFFFSGISLAILPESDRYEFFRLLAKLKKAGVSIVFDPNYRARMWRSPEYAINAFEQAYALSDILLPGIDDFKQLYQLNSVKQIKDFCRDFKLSELIIKDGARSVTAITADQNIEIAVKPVDRVVDSTSAGDSFNGVYLGARLNGISIKHSVELASQVAAIVVQHPGAIVPSSLFDSLSR